VREAKKTPGQIQEGRRQTDRGARVDNVAEYIKHPSKNVRKKRVKTASR